MARTTTKFNIYINHRTPSGDYTTSVHCVKVVGATRVDGPAVTYAAAKHFGVNSDRVLALPTPRDPIDARRKVEATITLPDPFAKRSRLIGG